MAFKDDILKEMQHIYNDNTHIQATLRDNIESVSDDFSSLSESLDMCKVLMTNKVKFIWGSIQNKIKHGTVFIVTMFLRMKMS